MNLELVSFTDSGNLERERVVFRTAADLNAGDYTALCSASSEPGTATPGYNVAYWFPDAQIKAGDLVVLYTKPGNDSKKDVGEGRTAHFFYWSLNKPLWSGSANALVLIESAEFVIESPAETLEPEEPKGPSRDLPLGKPEA